MPNTTRHHVPERERTILFPFERSSLLAALAEAWANGQQHRPDGLFRRERRDSRTAEQPVDPSDERHRR